MTQSSSQVSLGAPRQRSGQGDGPPDAAPAARRHRRPGWRDPRILLGTLILLGSVLLGARVLATADDMLGVWAVRADLPTGAAVTEADLVRRSVRFASAYDADRYVSANDAVPSGSVLRSAVRAGELLPRGALGAPQAPLVRVPLAVESNQVPESVRQGSVVDVWVAPQTATASSVDAALVLQRVLVVAVPGTSEASLAPSGTRQVVVGVLPAQARELGPALGQALAGRVVLTQHER